MEVWRNGGTENPSEKDNQKARKSDGFFRMISGYDKQLFMVTI